MPTPDELLVMVNQILNQVQDDSAALGTWSQTEEGQQVIQFIVQVGKYNTTVGQGQDISIGDRLDRKLLEEIRDLLRSQLSPPVLDIDWQQVSRTLLEERLQLTTNPMTRGEDIAYQVEQVYVPLGLLERKKVPRRKQDVSPEQGSALYQEDWQPERSPQSRRKSPQEPELTPEVEVTQKFEHEQFLEQVLQQGQSPKSQGKRIAVIGEPGAGKTTLLQQIARWAAATFPDAIVIWVSLADLSQTKLKKYIFETWLTAVVEHCDRSQASDSIKDTLIQQCNRGRVWLLLDGLDEMQVSGNPLTDIQRQLQEGGWLQQARILLTCRLNLWDGDRKALTQFDTYRTLEFAYPDQVEQFIRQWFAPRSKAELSEALCAALKESGRERIRDLVKNPLRLTLLCFNWYLQQGQLPETQAELYQRYVDRIYEWKQEQFPTTLAQREQLNQALAKLSLAAIDDTDIQRQTRFRLRQSFVSRFLQRSAPGETPTLLDLALKIGWLNQIGVDADDPTQAVYAFYHPTFEEYFAALGIDDGRFFLNPMPRNPMAKEASYRVFEPQWRQVFLLWLGRKDVDKAQKDILIGSMMKFKDRCGGFYSDRAFLLAAVGIAEFKDCPHADAIVDQLVQWKFGHSNRLKQCWANFVAPAKVKVREDWAETTFSSTDLQRVIGALVRLLETTRNGYTLWRACDSLGEIGMGSEMAIGALAKVLEFTNNEFSRGDQAIRLGKIGAGNETAIRALVQLLETTQHKKTRYIAAESLGEIGAGNETAIRALAQIVETAQDEDICQIAAESLGEIGAGNEMAIRALVGLLESTQNKYTLAIAAESLGRIDPGNETAICVLVQVLETTQDGYIHWRATDALVKIGLNNEIAIQALVRRWEREQQNTFSRSESERLIKIGFGNETLIRELVRVLETSQDEVVCWKAASILDEIGIGNATAIQELVRVLETSQNETTIRVAASSLGKIDPGNETAIQTLIQLVKTTQDEEVICPAVSILNKIDPGNETIVQALVKLLETTQDENNRLRAAKTLEEIDRGNEAVIRALVQVIESTQSRFNFMEAARSLGKIGTGNKTVIRVLERIVVISQDVDILRQVSWILNKIDPGNEMVIWRLVRVLETAQSEHTLIKMAECLGNIDPGNETAIQTLVRVLKTTQDEYIRREVARSLTRINHEVSIQSLVQLMETTEDEDTFTEAVRGLSKIGTGNEIAIRALVQALINPQKIDAHWDVARGLGKIGTGNEMAIQALVQLMETTQDEYTLGSAVKSLGKIATGNEMAIRALVRVLEVNQDEHIRQSVVESLGEIATGNEIAIRALVQELVTVQKKDTCESVAKNLNKIDPSEETVIQLLVQLVETTQDSNVLRRTVETLNTKSISAQMLIQTVRSLRCSLRTKEAYQLMMKCAETMSYLEFYQAYHSPR